jgi:hypothetical protein
MWLAGTTRWKSEGTDIGFHQAFDGKTNKTVKVADDMILDYYQWLGIPKETAKKLYSAPPEEMKVLGKELATRYNISYKVIEAPTINDLPEKITGPWCFNDRAKMYTFSTNIELCPKENRLNIQTTSLQDGNNDCRLTEIHEMPYDVWRIKDDCGNHNVLDLDKGVIRRTNVDKSFTISQLDVVGQPPEQTTGQNSREAPVRPERLSRPSHEPQRTERTVAPERHERHERHHEAPRRVVRVAGPRFRPHISFRIGPFRIGI